MILRDGSNTPNPAMAGSAWFEPVGASLFAIVDSREQARSHKIERKIFAVNASGLAPRIYPFTAILSRRLCSTLNTRLLMQFTIAPGIFPRRQ